MGEDHPVVGHGGAREVRSHRVADSLDKGGKRPHVDGGMRQSDTGKQCGSAKQFFHFWQSIYISTNSAICKVTTHPRILKTNRKPGSQMACWQPMWIGSLPCTIRVDELALLNLPGRLCSS